MKQRNIKITIEYDGTNFKGWQIQTKGERTVQSELKKAIKKIFNQDAIVIGSGRTDRNAHAIGQVANFKIKSKLSSTEIVRALNGNLEKDISIINAKDVPLKFHSQYSAKSKTYRYTILNRKIRCPINRNFCLHYPNKLNLKIMKNEAKILLGKHNFKSFQASDPGRKNKENTIRTIKRLEITKKGDFIYIEITANGFLYKMVRNIVGTLLEIRSGKLPKGSMKKILAAKNRATAGYMTIQPHGLCLMKVTY